MFLFGVYVVDSWFGCYRIIGVVFGIDIIGYIFFIIFGFFFVIKNFNGVLVVFIFGIIIMGVGIGGFKFNVNFLIVEQFDFERMVICILLIGECVIVDFVVIVFCVYYYFYFFINFGVFVGQFSMVYCEYYVGFWFFYIFLIIMLCFCFLVMFWGCRCYKCVLFVGLVFGCVFKIFVFVNKGCWFFNFVKIYKNFYDGIFWENVKFFKIQNKFKWMDFNDVCKFCCYFNFLF